MDRRKKLGGGRHLGGLVAKASLDRRRAGHQRHRLLVSKPEERVSGVSKSSDEGRMMNDENKRPMANIIFALAIRDWLLSASSFRIHHSSLF
jgi:hypothetical protein